MDIRDCQRILQVPPEATLDEVKAAFRRLAFKLHPDLNPSPRAAEQFRELNEAYVLLSHALKDESSREGQSRPRPGSQTAYGTDTKTRTAKAEKAYAKTAAQGRTASGEHHKTGRVFHFREEEVLRDLLTDPFARQVFEDIYSELKHGRPGPTQPKTRPGPPPWRPTPATQERQPAKRRKLELTWGDKTLGLDLSKGIVGGVKSWLRGQLDDEQTVSYPAFAVGPGKVLRLTVSSRFGESRTVEVTLPQDFVVGRPVRLKGLGRKLGPFTGDLYLRVLAK